MTEQFDAIVIGAGHAGCEAALALARLSCKTALFTVSVDSIAMMPCNPNVGGTSKGHLVREIDALGGEMGKNIDRTFIQSKMLNQSKGPAVHSLRAQADKKEYIEGFKVSEAEFMWIQGLKEDSRMMLIKQGSRSAICKLDLGWAKEPLRVLSGSTDNINLIEQLRALVGENPDKWLGLFQQIKNDSKTVKQIQQRYGTEPELWLSHYLEECVNED